MNTNAILYYPLEMFVMAWAKNTHWNHCAPHLFLDKGIGPYSSKHSSKMKEPMLQNFAAVHHSILVQLQGSHVSVTVKIAHKEDLRESVLLHKMFPAPIKRKRIIYMI
jgi:hypothetical protein